MLSTQSVLILKQGQTVDKLQIATFREMYIWLADVCDPEVCDLDVCDQDFCEQDVCEEDVYDLDVCDLDVCNLDVCDLYIYITASDRQTKLEPQTCRQTDLQRGS